MLEGDCNDVKVWKQYEKLEKIGQGSYGKVYKGRDKETNEIVALKKVLLQRPDQGFPSTSIRETSILKEMEHANIVRCNDTLN